MISNLAKSAAGVCAALATTAMLLTGCGGGPPRAATAPSSSSFKVALLTPGPVSDAGWNAAAFDGLQLIKRELGAETAMVQTQSPADFEDAFRDFAQRGFTVIFAHGFEYTDTAIKVAKLFPKTWFIVTSGSAAAANVASITFRIEEGAYVEGVIAGGMTKSGVVGAIGGIKIPSIGLTFDGFRQGFLSVRPGGRVLISYAGSFDDVGAAKEAALAQISQGADLLIHNADAAGLGVFQAAVQSHIYAFGVNRDQNSVAPDNVLASVLTRIPKAFLRVATEVKGDTFKPGMIEYGMKDAMVEVVYNPRLADKIPAAVMAKAHQATQDIIDGKVIVAGASPAPAK
ncbi:MAG TPA: BMP family protein [Candidatus Binataceae bacterium]|nr:BMP family protein [Candidatus Binataceae bacterium]